MTTEIMIYSTFYNSSRKRLSILLGRYDDRIAFSAARALSIYDQLAPASKCYWSVASWDSITELIYDAAANGWQYTIKGYELNNIL